MNLTGHLDRCDPEQIAGWVIDRDDPARRVRLELFADGERLGECIADSFRPDLAKAGIGDGGCAFRFAPPAGLTQAALQSLKIRIGESGQAFCSGPGPLAIDLVQPPAADVATSLRKRFRICILHIGTEKTGTTSLQMFLGLNRRALAQAGHFVPQSLVTNQNDPILNHVRLAAFALVDTRFDPDLRGVEGVQDRPGLDAFRQRIRGSFEAEIAQAPAGCDTIVLSNEHCHSRLLSTAEVARLKQFLDPYCEEFRVVVYLRAQHELAASQYGMMLLSGICDIDMLPTLPYPPGYSRRGYTNRLYFDYFALLERWSAAFGRDAMRVRLFARDTLRNGSIIDDFMADIAPPDAAWRIPEPRNTNVSAEAQKFLIQFHRAQSYRAGGGKQSAQAGERVGNALRALYPGNGIVPARAEVAAFMKQFAAGNEKLRARWFPERPRLFEIDLSRYPARPDPADLPADTAYAMFADILLADQRNGG